MWEAVRNHESNGGCLTREVAFGRDPIVEYPGLQALRERDFNLVFPSMDAETASIDGNTRLIEDALHDHGDLLQQAVLHFRDLNVRYATLVGTHLH